MTTVEDIKRAIQALPPAERQQLIEELPALVPELDGDAAWEDLIRDARPRPELSALLDQAEVGLRRHPDAFIETVEAEFERHS